MVVDHHRRNGGDEPERGGQQRFGNAGRDHCEIGGLLFGNTDEAVHDAPNGAEQADKGRGRPDRAENGDALRHLARDLRLVPVEPRDEPFLQAFAVIERARRLRDLFARLHDDRMVGKGRVELRQRLRGGELVAELFRAFALPREFEMLGDQHGPGDERGEHQPDHHQLHHPVGLREHAPDAEVGRQAGRGRACPADLRMRADRKRRQSQDGSKKSMSRHLYGALVIRSKVRLVR